MKTLSGILPFGCFLVALTIVKADTVGYPGRSALLSYNPARGEFPVQSAFGRGYFNYIDETGSSRIVILEPNPLWGVRVNANEQPQIEIGRNVDLEKLKEPQQTELASDSKDVRKQEKLKPIKEFDLNPFVDSLEQKFVLPQVLPLPENLRLDHGTISTAAGVPQQGQIYFYKPTQSILKPAPIQGFGKPLKPVNFNPGNPFLPPNTGLVFLKPSPPVTAVVAKPKPPSLPNMGLQFPANSAQVIPKPSPPISPQKPAQGSPIVSMLGTGKPFIQAGITTPTPSPVFPNPPAPAISQGVFSNPTLPSPGNPFLRPMNNIKEQPLLSKPATVGVVSPPQFNPDKMNPFLPSTGIRTDLQPDVPKIQLVEPNLQYLPPPSASQLDSSSLTTLKPGFDLSAPSEQVKDTPEVEQAKRDHFLAHELALARLEMAHQQEDAINEQRDESSLTLNSDGSSTANFASSQAVTSGPSALASTGQTKVPCSASDAVPQVLPLPVV